MRRAPKRGVRASKTGSPSRLPVWREDSERSMEDDEGDRPATAVLSLTTEMRDIRSPRTNTRGQARFSGSRKVPERSFPGPGAYDEIRSDVESHHKRSYFPTIGRAIAPPTPKKRYASSKERLIGRDEKPEVGMSVMLTSAYAHSKKWDQGSGEITALSEDGSAFVEVLWERPSGFNQQLKWCSVGEHGEYWLTTLRKRKSTPPAQRFVLEALVSPRYDYDSKHGMFRVTPSHGYKHIPRNHSRAFGMGTRKHVPPGSIVSEIMREVLSEAAKRRSAVASEKEERAEAPAPKTQFRTAADDERDRKLNEHNAAKSKLQRGVLQVMEAQGKELRKKGVGRALGEVLAGARNAGLQFKVAAIDDDDENAKEEVRAKTLQKVRERQAQKLGLDQYAEGGASGGSGGARGATCQMRRTVNRVRVVQKLLFAPLGELSPIPAAAPPPEEEKEDESAETLAWRRKAKKTKAKTKAERLAEKGYELRMNSVLLRDAKAKANSSRRPRPPAGTAPAGGFWGRVGLNGTKDAAGKGARGAADPLNQTMRPGHFGAAEGAEQSTQGGESEEELEKVSEESGETGGGGGQKDGAAAGTEREEKEAEETKEGGGEESRDYGSDGFESEGEEDAPRAAAGEAGAVWGRDQPLRASEDSREGGSVDEKGSQPVGELQSEASALMCVDASADGHSGEEDGDRRALAGAGAGAVVTGTQASEEEDEEPAEAAQKQQRGVQEDARGSEAEGVLETRPFAEPECQSLDVGADDALAAQRSTESGAQLEAQASNPALHASDATAGSVSGAAPSSEAPASGVVAVGSAKEAVPLNPSPPAAKRAASFAFGFQRARSTTRTPQQAAAQRSLSVKIDSTRKQDDGAADAVAAPRPEPTSQAEGVGEPCDGEALAGATQQAVSTDDPAGQRASEIESEPAAGGGDAASSAGDMRTDAVPAVAVSGRREEEAASEQPPALSKGKSSFRFSFKRGGSKRAA